MKDQYLKITKGLLKAARQLSQIEDAILEETLRNGGTIAEAKEIGRLRDILVRKYDERMLNMPISFMESSDEKRTQSN